jgi:hypothetical protein
LVRGVRVRDSVVTFSQTCLLFSHSTRDIQSFRQGRDSYDIDEHPSNKLWGIVLGICSDHANDTQVEIWIVVALLFQRRCVAETNQQQIFFLLTEGYDLGEHPSNKLWGTGADNGS